MGPPRRNRDARRAQRSQAAPAPAPEHDPERGGRRPLLSAAALVALSLAGASREPRGGAFAVGANGTSAAGARQFGQQLPRRARPSEGAEPARPADERPPVSGAARAASAAGAWTTSRRSVTAFSSVLGLAALALVQPRDAKAAPTAVADAVQAAIEKPPLDARQYKAITLANGLEVLLVSDPESDRAGAALDVHVGYFSDPEDFPGMAHFCEHMIFLGTEKFPEENSFDTYLSANGGNNNAFTDEEDTCFFFSCGAPGLDGALERFGSFFQSPLFTPSATEREINAIDSENAKNQQSDAFRLNQVNGMRANPAHPVHKFGTGSKATLVSKPGRDLRERLLEHYERYYRAPLMTLCVFGKDDVKTLASLAEKHFAGIRGAQPGALAAVGAPWRSTAPYLPEAFASGFEVVPVADERALQVSFPIVFARPGDAGGITQDDWQRLLPYVHVAAVLGHEGPKGLCALLRRRGWATALSVGPSEDNENFALFGVTVELTTEGLARRQEVLELIFGYVRLVRELPAFPKELIAENVQLSEANWRCQEAEPPSSAVVSLAGRMQKFRGSPKDYVQGGARLLNSPDMPGLVAEILKALTPDNVLATVVSKSLGPGKEAEPWYGTRLTRWPVAEFMPAWKAAQPLPGLEVPKPNPFLPRSLDLKAPRARRRERGTAVIPEERRKDDRFKVFFRQDTEFGIPKAYVYVQLLTPFPRSSAKCAIMSRLYELLIDDALKEELLYDANVAGLIFGIRSGGRGLLLSFGGYDDRLVDFARTAMAQVRAWSPAKSADRFEAQRDVLVRELDSFRTQQPFAQAGYYATLATTLPDFKLEELQNELGKAKLSDVAEFVERLWTREAKYAQVLAQGNLRPDEADKIVAAVENALPFEPLPEGGFPRNQIVQVTRRSTGPGSVLVNRAMDAKEENSAVSVIYQTGSCWAADGEEGRARWAATKVLAALLNGPFYGDLRTKQQLGYVVQCIADRKEGVVRFVLVVQGTAVDPVGVLERIDAWVAGARKELLEDRPGVDVREQVSKVAQAAASERLARPDQLLDATERSWREIASREFLWERQALEAKALAHTTREDLLRVWDQCFMLGGGQRRRLVSMIFGSAHKKEYETAAGKLKKMGADIIEDAKAFAVSNPRWSQEGGAPEEPLGTLLDA